jgi:hypothetical protein
MVLFLKGDGIEVSSNGSRLEAQKLSIGMLRPSGFEQCSPHAAQRLRPGS